MSTRFFTNAGSNTLLARLDRVLNHNPDIEWFDALVAEQPDTSRASLNAVRGFRSVEFYRDPADCARIATIYSGLAGLGQFLHYSKGDPKGNRWLEAEPLFIEWTRAALDVLQNSPDARWQGHGFFLKEGVSWSDTGNHVVLKARFMPVSINDVKSMRLTPLTPSVPASAFLAVLNSDVFSYCCKRFVNNTAMYQISDLRQMPFIIPTAAQAKRLCELAERAMEAKRCEFANQPPSQTLAAFCRAAKDALVAGAPAYLRPDAQEQLLATPTSCLAVIERTVNWEAEKLYDVEGLGPFDEF